MFLENIKHVTGLQHKSWDPQVIVTVLRLDKE